jgi:hypothetical protein
MNTLTINSKAALTLARATERARAEKPLVRKTPTYGVYEVRSSSNNSLWYTVKCVSATREMTCNCSSRKPCKHIAAVLPLHSYIARQRQEAEKAASQAAPAPAETAAVLYADILDAMPDWSKEPKFCTCGEIATTKENYCDFCQAEKDRSDLFN